MKDEDDSEILFCMLLFMYSDTVITNSSAAGQNEKGSKSPPATSPVNSTPRHPASKGSELVLHANDYDTAQELLKVTQLSSHLQTPAYVCPDFASLWVRSNSCTHFLNLQSRASHFQ